MPIHSMTAYGQGESQSENWQVRCEIRTLNSRFIEVGFRLPKELASLEPELTTIVKKELTRGKVSISIELCGNAQIGDLPQLNEDALCHYLDIFLQMQTKAADSQRTINWQPLSLPEITKLQGVLVENKLGEGGEKNTIEVKKQIVHSTVLDALREVKLAREREGASLQKAILQLLAEISENRLKIEQHIPDLRAWIYDAYSKRMRNIIDSLSDLGKNGNLPTEERILAEVCQLTEKADIAEELTQLKTHEDEFQKILSQGGAVGRKLDFLCQELHREINTISSKIQSVELSTEILNIKQAVERIRQQIQNIE
ncbi:MAG: YicC/YloC family endoribonuclease [Bdellovibrionota bacterium]